MLVNAAVIAWFPAASVGCSTEEWPPPSTACGAPRSLPSAWNCTVPATPPPPVLVTVAVNVTSWPGFDGFADQPIPVLLGWAGGGLTWWLALASWVGGHGPVGPGRRNTA